MRKLLLVVAAFLLAACGPGVISAREAWARPTAAGGTAAVYFELANRTAEDDILTAVTSEIARVIEMHHSMGADELDGMVANSGGEGEPETDVMVMAPLAKLEIRSGEKIVFEPGSYHLMLIDLQRELIAGDQFSITLHFEDAADLEILVNVLSP
ncbi:MAG: copper chaperone PCu(A)C [Anaerolineales bacterium]